MEFKELLQLAHGNSSIAKKKSEKLSKGIDGKNANVTSSAVTAYLAKKEKERKAQLAAEDEARRKRIAARVNESLGKKEKEQVEKNKQQAGIKSRKESTKNGKHERHKQDKRNGESSKNRKVLPKDDKRNGESSRSDKVLPKDDKRNGESSRSDKVLPKDSKRDKLKEKGKIEIKTEKHKTIRHESESESEHRKEKQRTNDLNHKKAKQKVKSTKNGSSSLSFMDLAKLAKLNSDNPGSAKVMEKQILKRQADPNPEKTKFDPDRDVKIKKPPPLPPAKKARKSDKDVLNNTKHEKNATRDLVKEKKHQFKDKVRNYNEQRRLEQNKQNRAYDLSQKPKSSRDVKPQSQPREPVQGRKPVQGLVVETVSSSKNYAGKLQKKYLDAPKRGRDGDRVGGRVGGGIAAQYGKSNSKKKMDGKPPKRSADDYEDEFDKEEKMLAKKRKLFEMRRITGNKNLTEDDLFDDDYDLSEEDEEDDDFIDDTENAGNVSKYIRSIFGYDRRRFEDTDEEDLDAMESSYSQIEKEEARSARIAKIEDDYERMKEEEAEQKKLEKKSKK